jgi:predicted TIM-barrel fold metal-dependent hydrolase
MVIAGVFDHFPKLRIYWAENQVGWIPFYYEQMDLEYERNHFWAEREWGVPPLKRRPSEYLREHAYWGFFDDPLGMRLRNDVGVDRIIWGSDFPHVVTTWPSSVEKLDEQLRGAPQSEKDAILGGNLRSFLHLPAGS